MEAFGELSRILGATLFNGLITALLFLTVAYNVIIASEEMRNEDLGKALFLMFSTVGGAISGVIAGLIISVFNTTILLSAVIGGAAFGVYAFLMAYKSLSERGFSMPLKDFLWFMVPLVLSAGGGILTASIFNKPAV